MGIAVGRQGEAFDRLVEAAGAGVEDAQIVDDIHAVGIIDHRLLQALDPLRHMAQLHMSHALEKGHRAHHRIERLPWGAGPLCGRKHLHPLPLPKGLSRHDHVLLLLDRRERVGDAQPQGHHHQRHEHQSSEPCGAGGREAAGRRLHGMLEHGDDRQEQGERGLMVDAFEWKIEARQGGVGRESHGCRQRQPAVARWRIAPQDCADRGKGGNEAAHEEHDAEHALLDEHPEKVVVGLHPVGMHVGEVEVVVAEVFMEPDREVASPHAGERVVGDHPGGDRPDHEPATFPRQGGWIGGLNEDAAEPLGKKIVGRSRGDAAGECNESGEACGGQAVPRTSRHVEPLGVKEDHDDSSSSPGEHRQPGGPRLQEQDHHQDGTCRHRREPAPFSAEDDAAAQAPRQDQGEDAGVEIHARHQSRDLFHRPAAVDAQTELRDDLVTAHGNGDEPGHDDHPQQLLLPPRHDWQQQAGEAEREKGRQRAEDIGEAGRDVDRDQQRPAGDEDVAGEERDDRLSKHGEIEQTADPRHAHDDNRHEQEDQHRQQPGDQGHVDGGVVDETVEGNQHEAEKAEKQRLTRDGGRCRGGGSAGRGRVWGGVHGRRAIPSVRIHRGMGSA